MSYKVLVLDASTLILLAKIDLLASLAQGIPLVVTEEVKREATRKPELFDAQMIRRLLESRQIKVGRSDSMRTRQLMADFQLDAGEASSLELARERSTALGTDDGVAMKACRAMGIPFVTAIHLLVAAYEEGKLDRATGMAKLEKLQRFGRYHPRILEDAVKCIQGGEAR